MSQNTPVQEARARGFVCEEPGWWTTNAGYGVCREKGFRRGDGRGKWYVYPERGGMHGPFDTLVAAMDWCEADSAGAPREGRTEGEDQ